MLNCQWYMYIDVDGISSTKSCILIAISPVAYSSCIQNILYTISPPSLKIQCSTCCLDFDVAYKLRYIYFLIKAIDYSGYYMLEDFYSIAVRKFDWILAFCDLYVVNGIVWICILYQSVASVGSLPKVNLSNQLHIFGIRFIPVDTRVSSYFYLLYSKSIQRLYTCLYIHMNKMLYAWCTMYQLLQ